MIRKMLFIGIALLIATVQCLAELDKVTGHNILRRDSPTLDPKSKFSKVELAQIRQGINDACQLANVALSFADVSTPLPVDQR